MKQNPFTLGYGRLPYKMVDRSIYQEEIINDFTNEYPTTQSYLISGLRGSGKTVFMTATAKRFRNMENWIVIDLNPERDLLNSLAAKLYVIPELYSVLTKLKLNFSLLGFGVAIDNEPPVSDIETAIELMLEQAQKLNLNILVTIDEVTSSQNIKIFASSYQIFIRRGFPLFLLMTGLPEHIIDIQNQKTLTFLYRSPMIKIQPLSLIDMEESYQEVFKHYSPELIQEMAKLTKGYSYAFQVLGYVMWQENGTEIRQVLPKVRQYLFQNAYEKMWSELSQKDQLFTKAIGATPTKRQDILLKSGLSDDEYSVYRKRLLDRGIVQAPSRGSLVLTLPLFDQFIYDKQ